MRREAGHALVVALFVIAATLAASAILAGALAVRVGLLLQENRNLHLTALTDAALAQTLAELSRDPGYPGTRGERPFGDGTLAVEVRPTGPTAVVVEVWARYAGAGRAARAEVSLLPLEVTRWWPVGFSP